MKLTFRTRNKCNVIWLQEFCRVSVWWCLRALNHAEKLCIMIYHDRCFKALKLCRICGSNWLQAFADRLPQSPAANHGPSLASERRRTSNSGRIAGWTRGFGHTMRTVMWALPNDVTVIVCWILHLFESKTKNTSNLGSKYCTWEVSKSKVLRCSARALIG